MIIKLTSIVMLVIILYSCKDNNDVCDDKSKGKEFVLVAHNLYEDSKGSLYFKCYNKFINDDRFLDVVYVDSTYKSDKYNKHDGIIEMNKVIDKASFQKISDNCFRDKNNYYVFHPMHDGGTLSIVDSCK